MTLDRSIDIAERHHQAGRLAEAERIYRQVLATDPANGRARHDLGVLALQSGQAAAALDWFDSVLRADPDAAITLNAAGNALRALGRAAEARAMFERAVELAPNYAEAHNNLGNALQDAGQPAAAAASYRLAMALNPAPALYSNLLYCLSHDEDVSAQTSFEAHRGYGERIEPALASLRQAHPNARDPHKRLRVGFVSGDLRRHAVSHFIEPVWRCFDRDRIEVIAYANMSVEDNVTQRLKALTDAWRNVGVMNDAQLVQLVRQDGADILIDLSGHTARNRLPVFARKPAPLQASWIGYPETTGLSAMDYYLADPHSAPVGSIDALYVEKLVRLPASVAFESPGDAPAVNDLPALSARHITFGSFNRLGKLSARSIELWSRTLQAVPCSRLLLGNVSDPSLRLSLTGRFAAHGIDAQRLHFHPRVALNDYLRLHHEVDIVLDTMPYTGGTTTQHSLWMGVPVLTLAGVRRAERISTANLARVGLSDWSTDSSDAFVARAVRATSELAALAELRAGLRDRIRASPLRQPDVVTRCIEQALRTMWRRWCDGLPPAAFAVDLPPAS